MVFMEDSIRAASLALSGDLPVGLHINFTEPFTAAVKPQVRACHELLMRFFGRSSYHRFLFNPLLSKHVACSFRAQYDEFVRLYRREPTHFDGHHHIHLCANMLLSAILPGGSRIRRSFTLDKAESSTIKRIVRRIIDGMLKRKYRTTDYFFRLNVETPLEQVRRLVQMAKRSTVELEVHPESPWQYDFLMKEDYRNAIAAAERGSYADL
jgi:predicted glycoside hydrolase/deacetylase ChbG (UPF0249 family)